MANRDIVAIGTSAGALEALRFLVGRLPGDLPASLLIVTHLPTRFPSALDTILSQSGALTATFAQDGDPLEHHRIYIAPAGSHLILEQDRLRLGTGQRENNARPAIDPLFRSVALCCGSRAIGVVLTGTLGDGASGLLALKQCGAVSLVQDPRDASFPEMPTTAISRARPEHVVKLAALPGLLEKLVQEPAGPPKPVPDNLKYEVEIAKSGRASMSNLDRFGRRSVLACPDCQGVMWEIDEGDLVRYRCHVGHAYTAELMSIALDESLTRALASALRALDERVALAERMRRQANESGRTHAAESWAQKGREFEREASVIRDSVKRVDQIAQRYGQGSDPRVGNGPDSDVRKQPAMASIDPRQS